MILLSNIKKMEIRENNIKYNYIYIGYVWFQECLKENVKERKYREKKNERK